RLTPGMACAGVPQSRACARNSSKGAPAGAHGRRSSGNGNYDVSNGWSAVVSLISQSIGGVKLMGNARKYARLGKRGYAAKGRGNTGKRLHGYIVTWLNKLNYGSNHVTM